MNFTEVHGRMQLVRDYDKKSCSYKTSFVFTDENENTIKVQSSDSVRDLSAEQIAMHKNELYINEYSDGHYALSFNQQS